MKIPFVSRILGQDHVEHRAGSYTEALTAQAYANALEPVSEPGALAAVESCVALIADPLVVAVVTGFALPVGTLHAMGRDVLRSGSSVWLIELDALGQVQLLRASAFDVAGRSIDPSRWSYELEFETPSGTVTRRAPGNGIIHVLTDAPPGRRWRGNAPWASAGLSASAMAEIERAIRDESKIPSGRIWTAPDGSTQDQQAAMARTIAATRGGRQTVAETVSKGLGQGALAAPRVDWQPTHIGMKHEAGNATMRDSVQASLSAAYGVHPGYFNPRATAPGMREIKRLAFLNVTLPLSRILADELSGKLNSSISIRWPNMSDQSVDVHLRARGVAALVGAGASLTDALVAGGLEDVGLADDDDDDDFFGPASNPRTSTTSPTSTDGRATRDVGQLVRHYDGDEIVGEHDATKRCRLCRVRSKALSNGHGGGGLEHAIL